VRFIFFDTLHRILKLGLINRMEHWLILLSILPIFVLLYLKSYVQQVQSKSLWSGPKLDTEMDPHDLLAGLFFTRINGVGGAKLAVYVPQNASVDLPWVIYQHGIMNNCENGSFAMHRELEGVANVCSWDYRGFGRSTGRANEHITTYDLTRVIEFVHARNKLADIYLVGTSLGSNVTLRFLDVFGSFRGIVRGVVLCHPLYSFHDVLENIGASLLTWASSSMNVKHVLPRLRLHLARLPILVLGSKADCVTPWQVACDVCQESDVACVEVGGSHFEINARAFETIRQWVLKFSLNAAQMEADSQSPDATQ